MPVSEPQRWLTLKLVDSVPIALNAGEVISMASLAQLVSPLIAADTLEALQLLAPDVTLSRAWEPITPTELQSLVARGDAIAPDPTPVSLETFLRATVPDDLDLEALVAFLNGMPLVVEEADIGTIPELPVTGTTNPLFPQLGYLDPAPRGVDARHAWQLGADGAGISIIDLEQGWLLTHQDLPQTISVLAGEINHDQDFHGTAVLGILVAKDDTFGTVGMAPAAQCNVISRFKPDEVFPPSIGALIGLAAILLNEGDVLLVEFSPRRDVDGKRTGAPAEITRHEFEAIRFATRAGIIVIEVAGNEFTGQVNNALVTWGNPPPIDAIGIDLATFTTRTGRHIFDPTRPDEFRDSHAIIVGAGQPLVPNFKEGYSNFGARVDCYSWGEGIVAPGAVPENNEPPDVTPTSFWPQNPGFGGTSGAAAIIAGVALLAQDLAIRLRGRRLNPDEMRAMFRDPNLGTPTLDAEFVPIGPQPDLAAIAQRLTNP